MIQFPEVTHFFSDLRSWQPCSDVFLVVKEMKRICLVIFVLCVCLKVAYFKPLALSMTEMERTRSMDESSDTESCENEDTGLNETISNIHFNLTDE